MCLPSELLSRSAARASRRRTALSQPAFLRSITTSNSPVKVYDAPQPASKPERLLPNPFLAMGYPEHFDIKELNYSVRGLKNLIASMSLQESEHLDSVNLAITASSEERDPEAPRTSFIKAYRTSKASDYTWALRENWRSLISQDELSLSRFEYLENSILNVNDQRRAIVSVDMKIVRGSYREIGIAVYDPKDNLNTLMPDIKRVHVIAQEFFGVLSTNTYHGRSMVMPQKEMVKFTRTLLKRYFKAEGKDNSAILGGFNIPQKLYSLKETCPSIPTDPSSILDAYYLYLTPTMFHKEIRDTGIMNSTSLKQVLERLAFPQSEINNVGNSAYFSLVAILKLMNPYERLRLKLDSASEALRFQEEKMMSNLSSSMRMRSDGDQAGYNRPITPITTALGFEDALEKIYR